MVDEANILLQQQQQQQPDESDHELTLGSSPSNVILKGYLSKWTNYIHGWQPRFMVLQDKTLSYCEYLLVWFVLMTHFGLLFQINQRKIRILGVVEWSAYRRRQSKYVNRPLLISIMTFWFNRNVYSFLIGYYLHFFLVTWIRCVPFWCCRQQ